jgi:hypothetical protein
MSAITRGRTIAAAGFLAASTMLGTALAVAPAMQQDSQPATHHSLAGMTNEGRPAMTHEGTPAPWDDATFTAIPAPWHDGVRITAHKPAPQHEVTLTGMVDEATPAHEVTLTGMVDEATPAGMPSE